MLFRFAEILIFLGFLLILIGIIFLIGSKIPFFGKLPGDIYLKKENFTFYFPITSCILISLILTIVFYLISRFFK